MEEQIGNAEVGLTENEILTYIGREVFQSAEETQQNDACSICQVRPATCLIHNICGQPTGIWIEYQYLYSLIGMHCPTHSYKKLLGSLSNSVLYIFI